MQLDIFEHSHEVMLRNALTHALMRRDPAASTAALAALASDFPQDPLLADAAGLLARLQADTNDGLAASIAQLEEIIEPAARRLLGNRQAKTWLAPFWRELGEAALALPFDPAHEMLHAAPLFLRAGDWSQAAATAVAIPSWRKKPAPLAWMIEACVRLDGIAVLWPRAAELAWMAPARAYALVTRLAADLDEELARLLRRFLTEIDAGNAPEGFARFPAWLLIEDARYLNALKLAERGSLTAAEACARLLLTLLSLEQQGRHDELIEQRQKLRETDAELFACYMRSR